jgi:endonuclease III
MDSPVDAEADVTFEDIHPAIRILRREVRRFRTPVVGVVAEKSSGDPFHILISTVLSLRTKDETTAAAADRLFALADTPETMRSLPAKKIEKAIYPVGFYKTKAENILSICGDLISRFNKRVPDDLDALLTLRGVGRKTANLVVTLGYGKPGICVDTHVHRISNRWGYVRTKTPERTEDALRKKLPPRYWIELNDLLVAYGQNICTPVSPRCSRCRLTPYCARVGVTKTR